MEPAISLKLDLLIFVIIGNSALAFLVYRYNPKSATNRIFGLLGVLTSVWLIANYVSIDPLFLSSSLLWIRLSIFFAAPLTLLFFLLAYTLPAERLQINRRMLTSLLVIAMIIMAITMSPYAFTSVKVINGSPSPTVGAGILPFTAFVISLIALTISKLIRRFKQSNGVEKRQTFFVMVGIGLMFGSIILTVFIPAVLFGISTFVSFLPLYALFFLAMTAYAIIAHHLFDIKVIATETLTFAIWLILFLRTLGENTFQSQALDAVVLLFVIVFGILLIKGVQDEVYQKEQLQLLSQAKTEFISIASHQLRTPLTAVKGYISLLLEGTYGKLAIKPEGVLKKVYVSNERLSNIVEDLLNVSRMDQGRLIYNFAPTDLIRVLTEIVDELKITAEIKHVDLSFEKPDDPAAFHMQADTEKLHQAIGNLVDNALKYTPQGSVRVKIEKTSAVPQKIVVTVRDSGIGLNPEDKMKIFERFSRGREGMRVNTKGTGLGLFIAKSIVESHGGTLRAESAGRNMGSSFIVELPLNFQPPIGKK